MEELLHDLQALSELGVKLGPLKFAGRLVGPQPFNQERHLVTRLIYKQRRTAALAEWRALAA